MSLEYYSWKARMSQTQHSVEGGAIVIFYRTKMDVLSSKSVTGAYLDAEVLVTGMTRKDVSLYHRLSMDRGSPLRLSLSLLLLYGDQFSWEEASIIIRVRAL